MPEVDNMRALALEEDDDNSVASLMFVFFRQPARE
jgi:hypothetical protein